MDWWRRLHCAQATSCCCCAHTLLKEKSDGAELDHLVVSRATLALQLLLFSSELLHTTLDVYSFWRFYIVKQENKTQYKLTGPSKSQHGIPKNNSMDNHFHFLPPLPSSPPGKHTITLRPVSQSNFNSHCVYTEGEAWAAWEQNSGSSSPSLCLHSTEL